ncbi:hypothetical protein PVOR_20169 [Paenibacillus vortex V453]|jgi:hypothetical protein|uniref:Uncharacterized protein n=1 Tax=Paenibacillus vortex V453 TaxID=715225 RepID=A0A2R9SQN6_9BACL|nr:hypothetical protein [Paenibacillus vortex]EFU39656.1 hypothetical protein PVOR_20169 [Paenibacillus vortex V453]
MKTLALGAGIFIVVELLLIMLLAVDVWIMIMLAAGVMITMLSLILHYQMKLVKSGRDYVVHQKRQKIHELNQKSREHLPSESASE